MVFRRDVGFVRFCLGDSFFFFFFFFGSLVVSDSVVFHGEEHLRCYAQVFRFLSLDRERLECSGRCR